MPSNQFVADLAARALQLLVKPRLKEELRFAEIPGRTSDITVRTRHGPVPCTVYHPASDSADTGVYVNLHGGGYVVEHPEQDDPWCRYLAANAGVTVINVDYSVAPRHRFPVAVEQVFDVVKWAAQDGKRVCVGGQSAGGGLAAAAARLAHEHKEPSIALQVLQYAPLDLVTHLRDKPSSVDKPVMRPWMSDVFDRAYVPDPGTRADRLVSPAWQENLEGLTGIAPALVITCEFDRLRDEGVRYAAALKAVGALAEHHDVPATDHGYNILGFGTRSLTERTYQLIAEHVRRATNSP